MEIKISEFLKNIENKKLEGVILIIGEEPYLVKVIIDKIKNFFNTHILWGDDISLPDLADISREGYIFSQEGIKVTILRNGEKFLKKLKKKDMEILTSLLKKVKKNSLVVVYESGLSKQDISREPFKSILSFGTVVKAAKQNRQRIKEIVKRKFAKQGKTIGEETLELMINLCGNDMMLLKQETDKLLIYTERKEITIEDVKKVCSFYGIYTIFDFIDAFFSKDLEKTLHIFKHLTASGIMSLHVFYMISNTALKLLIAHNMREKGSDFPKIFNKLGIYHKFQQIKFQNYIKNFDKNDVETLIELMYLSDRKIKVNYEDPTKVLEELIFKLFVKNLYNRTGSKFI